MRLWWYGWSVNICVFESEILQYNTAVANHDHKASYPKSPVTFSHSSVEEGGGVKNMCSRATRRAVGKQCVRALGYEGSPHVEYNSIYSLDE